MARTDTLPHFLEDLADAMRAKTGESGTIQASDFDTTIAGITTPPTLQDKQVTITENTTTTIEADSNYDGLGTVSVTTNVPTSTGGNTYSFYNDGTLTQNFVNGGINIVINENVPAYGFGSSGVNYHIIREATLNEGIEEIGSSAFYGCARLTIKDKKLPNSLRTIGISAFYNCLLLDVEKIPQQVINLPAGTFRGCSKLAKVSMPGIQTITGTSSDNGAFYSCTGLKQVWIGSSVKTNGLGRYVFNGCSALEKIYIDKPRATVESMSNYSNAWMNNTSKTGIIVCNDDEGFISQADFEALVIN